MKTILYYFTGTGNSLAAAKRIAAALGDTELVPIAGLRNEKKIVPEADRAGIVCPVYDAGLPVIVKEFAERLDAGAVPYLFAIVTMGGIGASALRQLEGILLRGCRRRLDAAFAVRMPGNFPPVGIPPSGTEKDEKLKKAAGDLDAIAVAIRKGQTVRPPLSPLSSLMHAVLYPPFANNIHEADRRFSVDDSCTSCGTCARVCPVGNIVMEGGRPQWQHRCELCVACLHFCPAEAIQLNMMRGTRGRGRYRHPDLKPGDMEAQRGEASSPAMVREER